jgi:hypothetical protein
VGEQVWSSLARSADLVLTMSRESDRFESSTHAQASSGALRPWLGVRFSCSGAYQRVFRAPDSTSYLARCPRCGRSVRFQVGEGGTSHRFFDVKCG